MPGRADTSLPNRHAIYIGTSGSGKSSAVKATLAQIRPARLIVWDPEGEYAVPGRRRSIAELAQYLAGAERSGKPYRVALECPPTPERFERFCRVVWAVSSADRPLVVVIEELADVTRSAGKASPAWGELIRRGRKYGITLLVVTQSPTEISKTVYRNVATKWVGMCETEAERARMAAELDIGRAKMAELTPLDYYTKRLGEPARRGKIRFIRGQPRL